MNTQPTDQGTPVAVLVRVSTKKQETDRQVSELRAVAESRGWRVVEIIKEAGIRGASKVRPGIALALEMAREGRIRKVLVHEVSRIGRRNSVVHAFIEDLTDAKVSLYWHAQSIETLLENGKTNPAAAIMLALLAEMARAERETLRERIVSGLAEARRKGRTLGRPAGTSMDDAELVEKHKDVAKQLRAGQSIRHTAAITGKAKGTVEAVKRAMEGRAA